MIDIATTDARRARDAADRATAIAAEATTLLGTAKRMLATTTPNDPDTNDLRRSLRYTEREAADAAAAADRATRAAAEAAHWANAARLSLREAEQRDKAGDTTSAVFERGFARAAEVAAKRHRDEADEAAAEAAAAADLVREATGG